MTFIFNRDNPLITGGGYFMAVTVVGLQPGMVAGCSAQAWMAFGPPLMFLAQANATLVSLLVPLRVRLWLVWARGVRSAGEAAST